MSNRFAALDSLKLSKIQIQLLLQGFHKWKRNVNHIWQVLLYARRLFYKIEVTNPMNVEAATLWEKDQEGFKERAKSCVMDWKETLYQVTDHPDPHYLVFSSYQDQLHGQVRDKMKQGASEEEDGGENVGVRQGKSYVATGSLTIFSENVLPASPLTQGPKSMPK